MLAFFLQPLMKLVIINSGGILAAFCVAKLSLSGNAVV